MWAIIGAILSGLIKSLVKMFRKSPEVKVEERWERKAADAVDRINDTTDPGYVLPDSAKDDKWGTVVTSPQIGSRVESGSTDGTERKAD